MTDDEAPSHHGIGRSLQENVPFTPKKPFLGALDAATPSIGSDVPVTGKPGKTSASSGNGTDPPYMTA